MVLGKGRRWPAQVGVGESRESERASTTDWGGVFAGKEQDRNGGRCQGVSPSMTLWSIDYVL